MSCVADSLQASSSESKDTAEEASSSEDEQHSDLPHNIDEALQAVKAGIAGDAAETMISAHSQVLHLCQH